MTGFLFRFSAAGLWILLGLLTVFGLACATASSAPASTPTQLLVAASEDGISPILATTVLRTGTQRVSFLLISPSALITAPQVSVATTYLDGDNGTGETRQAQFHLWPYGVRGAYSTDLTFDQPGQWQLDISVDDAETSGETRLLVDVAEQIVVPDIGSVPPMSRTKTLESEGGLKTLTTDFSPDPDLYLVSVAEAIQEPKPAVIVFATPAFCTSPTCGPQVDTLAELKELHRGEANFIHVEIYDNPDEIQGDLSRARLSEPVREWGFDQLPHWLNESWTYVLDSDGRVYQKFEGFVTLEELEETLEGALAVS